tara:strand:+ start:4418 stop:4726 length:309 start_codon:yes stop_codon:yes gene_type:complete
MNTADTKPAPIGSRANPSAHDCLPKLADDEPYFVIRAADPLAAAMVELHAYIGAGQRGAAHNKLAEILDQTRHNPPRPSESPKYRETFAISVAMDKWREARR